ARMLASALLLALIPLAAATPTSTRRAAATNRTHGVLNRGFVANVGQFDDRVEYAALAQGLSVFLTRSGTALMLVEHNRGLALRLRFLAANKRPELAATGGSPDRVNYLLGTDPSRWHTNLRTYRQVVYRSLWPGIDLSFLRRDEA